MKSSDSGNSEGQSLGVNVCRSNVCGYCELPGHSSNVCPDRCSACPPEEEGEGEALFRTLTGYDLYLMHKYIVDKEAELG